MSLSALLSTLWFGFHYKRYDRLTYPIVYSQNGTVSPTISPVKLNIGAVKPWERGRIKYIDFKLLLENAIVR